MVNHNRIHLLKKGIKKEGPVVYWMQRDQRVNDNWALLYAQKIALKNKQPLFVCFCLVPGFKDTAIRQYEFMIKGLQEVEKSLKKKNIPSHMLAGDPVLEIPKFIAKKNISVLVSDFNPLKIIFSWKSEIISEINIPFYEVDAHNIVPCRVASDKQEFAAYTIRPKINKLLDEYLVEFPGLKAQKLDLQYPQNDWKALRNSLQVDRSVKEADLIKPGEKVALESLKQFINNKFENYGSERNDPVKNNLSHLSPYLHFGQLAPQRAAFAVLPFIHFDESRKAFLEELIIRRELADNYCFYNPDYDSLAGIHKWAKDTLNNHRNDKREFIYTMEDFENAKTHDDLWNAAQLEMIHTGKMHGYMRMYWAKKILEWTPTPEEAFRIALYLNDKYELDGRDPNGYVGIAWSIGGVHDRAWTERPVFGKIRYMNLNGCKRKFDVNAYIKKHLIPNKTDLNL